MQSDEPPPPRGDRKPTLVVGVLVFAGVLALGVWAAIAERCSGAVEHVREGMDALRTDKTWRDSYGGLEAQTVDAFLASFRERGDPMLHPRMRHGVVVRGRVRSVDCAADPDPVLFLEGRTGAVRCRFDASRIDRLEELEAGREIVIGGALSDYVDGTPELTACHFEDEWAKR